MMIRNILIITVIAALVPTAMSNVSAPADAEIALFSGVSDTDTMSITGNGDSAKMELKATNDNGKSNRISDFQLTADNVLSTEVGEKATVIDNVDFTKAVTTDARNNQKAIGITSNGVIDFTGYIQGVYTLDVVVDDDRAYEAIIAIGDQTNQIVDKEITRVNSDNTIKFVFPPIEDPKPPKCNEGEELIDGKCEPKPPKCDEGEELIDGKCQPIPIYCPAHAGGCETPCKPSGDLDVCYPWDDEDPEPEPEPIECSEAGYMRQGNECVAVDCEQYEGNPCNDLIQPGNPNAAEQIIPVDKEVPTEGIDCELQPELCEEIPNVPLEVTEEEELPEEEELTETTEIEEIEEEEEEESGESEDEAEDEGSEQEGGNEYEEESEGGN